MAKTISDEQMKLSIIINGDPAQKELFDLEKATRKLTEENKALGLQKKLLIKQGKEETAEYKTLTLTMKANTAEINANKLKQQELQKQIGITGLTMHQLTQKAHLLKISLLNAVPGGEAYKKYTAELNQVNARLGELKGKSAIAKSSIGSLADSFNRYQGMIFITVAALTGMVLFIQKIVDINGKLSDAQSDVMKTTGLTKKEVDELTKSFGLLQTRTSRIDLLGIAEQGGRIGIAKAEIGDFVRVMNKASVSLGDSFQGGAEEVASKLGKIKFLFQETKDLNVDQAYNSIGSAINDLGANGVASEANIAEFTTRIGSLTDVLKPSIQETLALGTAFEESGIEAEVSSRAYGIFMKQASTETAKFAKVMGISEQKVKDMINSNPLEFMLQFAQGMKGMNATDTAKTLDALGISADGANKVIGAMGNNTARFRELIDLSNDSFASGTSLINEYNIKNNNLAATLEKISKTVAGWFSSESFIKWLGSAVEGLAKFIGATEDADGTATAWRNTLVFTAKVIAIVTAAIITNVSWQKLVALWTTRNTEATLLYNIAAKARAFADGVAMVASQAYAAVTMLLTGNIKGASQAFRIMTATMMSTPWGFILGAVAAVTAAYVLFSDEAKQAETSQSLMNKTIKETNQIVNQETVTMRTLLAIAQDETASKEARLAAIKKLKEIAPEYLKTLTLENVTTAEGKKLIDAYVQSLEKRATLEVLIERQKAITKAIDEKKNMALEEEIHLYDKAWAIIKNFGNAELASADVTITASQRKTKALADLQKNLSLTNTEMEAFIKKNPSLIGKLKSGTEGGSEFTLINGTETGTKKDPNSSFAEINRRKIEEVQKTNDELLALDQQLQDDKLSVMKDGAAKEILIEQERYLREIKTLEAKKVHIDELAKLDAVLAKAKEDGNKTEEARLFALKQGWTEKNKIYDDKINLIIQSKLSIHNKKLGIIEEKAAKDSIEKSKVAFDQAKILRETKFNEEYIALGNNKKAKAKLKKEFEANELKEETKFLNELIDKLNTITDKGKLDGIDLTLLTPEQVENFKAEAAKVGLTLSELISKKNELSTKQVSNAESLGISKGETDIFGFTPDNWEQFYNNVEKGKFGVDEMVFAVSALVNIWGKYNQMVTANENKQLQAFEKNSDQKKIKLKKQLDSGVISQKTYEKQVSKIDLELDHKKADLSYKQAKRERMIAIASAISGTAMAVVGALGNKPWTPFNFVLAKIVGAMGLLQLGTILAQPLPAKGLEAGLYPEYVKRSQDGKVFQSKYQGKTRSGLVSDTSHFLVAENGPEMVIDNKAWRQMNPAVKDSLIRELNGIKGFEKGLYNQETKRYEVPDASSSPSSNDAQMLQTVMALVAENTAIMKELKDKVFIGVVTNKDLKSMGYLQEGIDAANQLREKSKR